MSEWLHEIFRDRPLWMNALMVFCAFMTFIYVPWDIFWKPVSQDQEVWFGILFTGWAAKLTAPGHWFIYAAGTYGFRRMRPWMCTWGAVYAGYLGLTALGVLGFVRARPANPPQARGDACLRAYLVAAIATTLAAHIWLNTQTAQPQGRHLFPVAPQIACVLAIGMARSFRRSDLRVSWSRVAFVVAGLFALALYCLLGVVVPGYAPTSS